LIRAEDGIKIVPAQELLGHSLVAEDGIEGKPYRCNHIAVGFADGKPGLNQHGFQRGQREQVFVPVPAV
jgi:hypothetical protein